MADLNTSLALLKSACDNPRAQLDRYLAEGKKVVGCFPPYTPEELVHAVMTNTEMWGQDLTEVPGFEAEAVRVLKVIRGEGALAAYKECLKNS